MKGKKKNVRLPFLGSIPKKLAIVFAVLLVGTALGVTSSLTLATSIGVMKARIAFLEKMATLSINQDEIDQLWQRARNINLASADTSSLAELHDLLETLEEKLPRPVVFSNSSLNALMKKQVFVVGVVTRVSEKNPHVFITVNDVLVPVFNAAGKIPALNVGDLVAVAGKVEEYNSTLEVVADSPDAVMLLSF